MAGPRAGQRPRDVASIDVEGVVRHELNPASRTGIHDCVNPSPLPQITRSIAVGMTLRCLSRNVLFNRKIAVVQYSVPLPLDHADHADHKMDTLGRKGLSAAVLSRVDVFTESGNASAQVACSPIRQLCAEGD